MAVHTAAPAGVGKPSAVSFTFSNATVPEPPTWAMMLTGFAGLGFIGYRGLLGQRG
jgi:hypothetical protein